MSATDIDDARPAGPGRVAQSEADLLTITRALFSRGGKPFLLLRSYGQIESIGPTAMGLLQQTLTRGLSLEILRRGGWQRRRFLHDEHGQGLPRRGRLWERHRPLPALHFSRASFELLTWLHRENVTRPKRPLPRRATTFADEALLYLAAARITEVGGSLREPAFLHSPICQLGYADVMAELADDPAPVPAIDFRPLVGRDVALLEALQPDLARRWEAMENRKRDIKSLELMSRLGAAQEQALANLFTAIDGSEPRRRDLAGFIAETAELLLARGPERLCPDHRWWTRSLDMRASLSARQRAFTASAAFLRAVVTLGGWLNEAGLVAHFDDDYETAQLLLSSWRFVQARQPGPQGRPEDELSILERASALTRTLESLHSLGTG
ncbi:MAG: hypothetical protein KC457_20305 [Myxococcales bacterium]|nr:hypothetical protein [Myxococcales bacterium]